MLQIPAGKILPFTYKYLVYFCCFYITLTHTTASLAHCIALSHSTAYLHIWQSCTIFLFLYISFFNFYLILFFTRRGWSGNWPFRSSALSFPGAKDYRENFRSRGTFVPWNIRSRGAKSPRTFVPCNFRSCGTFAPQERMFQELSFRDVVDAVGRC